ncbi:MAG: beta-lactamase family protein [Steroidobacteraceae bacterium]|nr:beta-lactamase family protein [Steroidobacteraceae bacterium]MDW8259662.1 serine hydrolase [Gammaproteobacteria bacterium]
MRANGSAGRLRRRAALIVVATLIVLLSTAIGIALADLPYLQRVARVAQLTDTGEWPDDLYRPVSVIAADAVPAPHTAMPRAADGATTIDPSALAAAAAWAEANNSVALLVWHRGALQLERYWQDHDATKLFSGRAMTRSVLGLAFGFAVADGKLSLDDPAQRFLQEWRNEPRGRITLRELLQNISGLEEVPLSAPSVPADAAPWQRLVAFWRLYSGKSTRLSLGTDFVSTALSFDLAHQPGYRFALSNANAQILGVILERATGVDYEKYVEQRLWRPIGGHSAEFYMDRANGMPAVYCCMRALAVDFLKLGLLLAADGVLDGRRVLPAGWVAEMARTSRVNPLYGLQIWAGRAKAGVREYATGSGIGPRHSEDYLADDVLWMEGGGGRTVWAVPSRELVIVRLGRASPNWDASYLPNTLLRGIRE